MSDGTIACSEELYLTSSSGTLTKLVSVISTGLPTITVDEVDITTQNDNCVTRRRAGLIDVGPFSVTLLHDPSDPDHALINEHVTSKETRPAKIVYGDENGRYEVTFDAFIVEYNFGDETAPGAVRNATMSIRATSLPTLTAVA